MRLMNCDSGRDTYLPTMLAGTSYPPFCGGSGGFGPPEEAFTVTPACCNASMNAERANAAGSATSCTTRVGALPAAIVPVTTSAPGVCSVICNEVDPPAATVVTSLATVY